jgi:hypothetical protein
MDDDMSKSKPITDAARPSVVDDSPREVVMAAAPGRAAELVAGERRVLAELQERREAQLHRKVELESERRAHAHAAHAQHDKEASKLLTRAIDEMLRVDQHILSLSDAVSEQERVLARAEAAAAREADRAQARRLGDTLIEFLQCARRLDDVLAQVAVQGHKLHELQQQMHALGAAVPSAAQLDSLGARCLLTAVAQMPWRRHFETIAPHERRSFAELCAYWGQTIERNIATRLGEAEPATKIEPEVVA